MKIYVKHPYSLKRERIKKGYTQAKFAEAIGISNVRLCQIERNPMSTVSIPTANKIINLLKCEWSVIFEFREE